jgi:hypothetical protein
MLGERTSYKSLACCGFIIGGFFLGIDQENSLGQIKIINKFIIKHSFSFV